MKIENNILKEYLKNVYFITGTAYAGKSTIVDLLSKRFGLIKCGENYHSRISDKVAVSEFQPNLCYFDTMKDWQEFISRTPDEYDRWITEVGKEAAEFEIVELIRISKAQKVIVDTNIPLNILREVADYNHVAVMLAPQSMSVDMFFEREDPEKMYIKEQIENSANPHKAMLNYKKCLAKVNSQEHYDEFAKSGFFTLYRTNTDIDTREEVLEKLAKHFGFIENDSNVEIVRIQHNDKYWNSAIDFAENCSWIAGKHMAGMLKENRFTDWESFFIAVKNNHIIGYCSFLKEDYYPENRYSPWISGVFVTENERGKRVSHKMIEAAVNYAKENEFSKVYIPSDMKGFYEKCGFAKIDKLKNYGGDEDDIFMLEI